jgi:hypothetical protein
MYYHSSTNQLLSREEILTIVGVDIETTCEENLISFGLLPVENKMGEGILDNPEPVFVVDKGVAVKSNSPEPIDYCLARMKTQVYLKNWLNSEVKRLIENNGMSESTLCLSMFMDPNLRTREVNNLIDCVTQKTNKIFSLLKQAQETSTVEELKQLLIKFEQSEDLHGDP